MRTKEPNGIMPERSQVADKIMDLMREDYGNSFAVAKAVGIPRSLIMDLTFRVPVSVIQGGGPRKSSSLDGDAKMSNFRSIKGGVRKE